jgi:hypothetical protein
VPDPGLDREALLAEARADAERARAAAAELVAVGSVDGSHMSPAARDMLLDRLADLLASFQELTESAESVDSDLGFVLRADPQPGATTVVHANDGVLTIEALRLTITELATSDVVEDLVDAAAGGGA